MYVTTRWNASKTIQYVYLMENHWDKEKKRSVTCRIKTLGTVADLTREDPDAVEKLKQKYARLTEENHHRIAPEVIEAIKGDTSEEEILQRSGQAPLLNYTYYIVRSIWKELQLDVKMRTLTRGRDFEFDVDKTVQYMVASKLVDPSSHLKCWDRLRRWVGVQTQGIQLQHLYRSLDYLLESKDDVLKWINRKLLADHGRDLSMIFYDVTNTWFETPYDDNEKACRKEADALNKTSFEMESEGVVASAPLRMRGPSKEKRFDMPIMSVALVIDKDGIPIDYRVCAGNTSEKTEFKNSIQRLKDEYGIERSVVVADRGLNSTENILDLLAKNHNFLVAQSVHQLNADTVAELIDEKGWTEEYGGAMKIKELEFDKTCASGTAHCRLIVTLTGKRMAREFHELQRNWARAQKAVTDGLTINKGKTGWESYVVAQKGKMLRLNTKKFRKDLSLVGMYGIICSVPKPGTPDVAPENTLTALEIYEKYHSLGAIEDCFRVMKSALNLRPVYVHRDEHIKGHVQLCVLSLIVLRLLEKKLRLRGTPMSTDEILSYLKEAAVVPVDCFKERVVYQPIQSRMRAMRSPALRFEGDDTVNGVDLIMKTVNLTPLTGPCDRSGLARCLETKFKTDDEVYQRQNRNQ
jgi:hypothetical protein